MEYRDSLEAVLRDIGLQTFGFKEVRDSAKDVLFSTYGVPALPNNLATNGATGETSDGTEAKTTSIGSSTTSSGTSKGKKATASNDPRSVKQLLKTFVPKGKYREKVVTLLAEARTLKLETHPHAFCFLLRSMFELSAKAFCKDHKSDGLSAVKPNGEDRQLVDVLRDITEHLTKGPDGKKDKALEKIYHGPMAEIAKSSGFLSVTSLNQLVHNPKFTVDDTHISTLFGNVFPLLEAMNS